MIQIIYMPIPSFCVGNRLYLIIQQLSSVQQLPEQ